MKTILAQLIALLLLLILGGAGVLFYFQHQTTLETKVSVLDTENKELKKEKQVLEQEKVVLEKKNDQLTVANAFLKVDSRVARIEVLAQKTDSADANKVLESTIRFTEFDPSGAIIIPPREITIPGDLMYVDALVVKFRDEFIEQNDALRSRSLLSFRRIFGEDQKPTEGTIIDREHSIPTVYDSGDRSEESKAFEKKIWDDFWTISNDPAQQEALGIRSNHGEAPSQKLQSGRTYKVTLRSSGGLSIESDNPHQ